MIWSGSLFSKTIVIGSGSLFSKTIVIVSGSILRGPSVSLSKFQPVYYHPKAIYTVILIFYKAQQMISQWFTSTYRIVLYLKYKLGLLIHDQCFVQDIHCNPRQLFHARHL